MDILLKHNLNPDLADTPLWLLDIDGVINAYSYKSHRPPKEDMYDDYTEHYVPSNHGIKYKFWVSRTLTEKITEIHHSKKVEIAWLTTWQTEANKHVSTTLGLPIFPVAAQNNRLSFTHWKRDAAHEALHLGRPIIWTDDDEIDKQSKTLFKSDELDHLLLVPNPSVGLTRTHINKIETFIEKHETKES